MLLVGSDSLVSNFDTSNVRKDIFFASMYINPLKHTKIEGVTDT